MSVTTLLFVLVALLVGLALGTAVSVWVVRRSRRRMDDTVERLFESSEARQKAETEAVINRVTATVGDLTQQALTQTSDELLKRSRESLGTERQLAAKDLDGQKQLIDRQLEQLAGRLGEVATLVAGLEKDRSRKYGEIAQALENTNRQTAALLQSSNALREALASTKARGQWGERMAEDVLRTAGFVEKVNYLKQSRIEGAGTTPDFTFLLPRGFRLNMDVKFPLDNYMRYLEAEASNEKDRYRDRFLKDVRARIHEITDREYINPQQQTLPYVLLFIPNEQIFTFIHEQDATILDDALRCRTLVCSPITLFAVLAVIRQAMDNFMLEQTSHEVLSMLAEFRKQWNEYVKAFDSLGKQLETVGRTYDRLTTTRTRGLDRRLEKLDELRISRERELDPLTDDELAALPEVETEELH